MKKQVELVRGVLYTHLADEIGFSIRCLKCTQRIANVRVDNETFVEGDNYIIKFYILCNNCGNRSTLSTATIEQEMQGGSG